MPDERWPNPRLPYDAEHYHSGAVTRWQDEIDRTLDDHRLNLDPPANGLQWARDLSGKCPRCDHQLRPRRLLYKEYSVAADYILPNLTVMAGPGRSAAAACHYLLFARESSDGNFLASFEIVCTCSAKHLERPPDVKGCGAGTDLWIKLRWRWGPDGY